MRCVIYADIVSQLTGVVIEAVFDRDVTNATEWSEVEPVAIVEAKGAALRVDKDTGWHGLEVGGRGWCALDVLNGKVPASWGVRVHRVDGR